MELRNAASISGEALLLSMHMTHSITEASQGSMILPLSVPVKPNASWDIRKISPNTVVPWSASGTSNRMRSAVYTMQWSLPLMSTTCCTTLLFLPPALLTTRGRKQWLKGDDEDG